MITYSDFQSKLNDTLKDAQYSSDHSAEILRATNRALDDINVGEVGEPNDKEVTYDFQRKQTTISFVKNTYNYTQSLTDFKFCADLRVHTDEDEVFSEVDTNYFFRKKGVFSSQEKMYTYIYNGITLTMKINHDTTETLDLDYYSNNMVLNTDGSTLQKQIINNNDKFLIPEIYINVLEELSAAYLFQLLKGTEDDDFIFHLKEGRNRLKRMISSIGRFKKQPSQRVLIHNEMGNVIRRITTK